MMDSHLVSLLVMAIAVTAIVVMVVARIVILRGGGGVHKHYHNHYYLNQHRVTPEEFEDACMDAISLANSTKKEGQS